MTYDIVCMDIVDKVDGESTMKEIYDYCNSSYGCGEYGYDLKLPSGERIEIYGCGKEGFENKTLDSFVTDYQKGKEIPNFRVGYVSYDEMIESLSKANNEYEFASEIMNLTENLGETYQFSQVEACVNAVKEGFPVCLKLDERQTDKEILLSQVPDEEILRATFSDRFMSRGGFDALEIYVPAIVKFETDGYSVSEIVAVDKTGQEQNFKLKEPVIISDYDFDFVSEKEIPATIKEMALSHYAVPSEKAASELDLDEMDKTAQKFNELAKESENFSNALNKLGMILKYSENSFGETVIQARFPKSNPDVDTYWTLDKNRYKSGEEIIIMSDAIKRLPLHEKNPAKIIDAIEKTIEKYKNFQKEYIKDGIKIDRKQLEKEYGNQKDKEKENSLSR